jgi:hypothetical protein
MEQAKPFGGLFCMKCFNRGKECTCSPDKTIEVLVDTSAYDDFWAWLVNSPLAYETKWHHGIQKLVIRTASVAEADAASRVCSSTTNANADAPWGLKRAAGDRDSEPDLDPCGTSDLTKSEPMENVMRYISDISFLDISIVPDTELVDPDTIIPSGDQAIDYLRQLWIMLNGVGLENISSNYRQRIQDKLDKIREFLYETADNKKNETNATDRRSATDDTSDSSPEAQVAAQIPVYLHPQ